MSDNAEDKPRSLEDQVRDALVDQLWVKPERVTADADFANDLGADELDLVEFVIWLEEQFGIAIPETDADGLTTLATTAAYLRKRGVA